MGDDYYKNFLKEPNVELKNGDKTMTTKMTITEALAEIKLLDKRLNKKNTFIKANLVRQDIDADPLQGEGVKVIASELQAYKDLLRNVEKIKLAIHNANNSVQVTIENQTKTIAEWLTWKSISYDYLAGLQANMNAVLLHTPKSQAYTKMDGTPAVSTTVYNYEPVNLQKEVEELETIYEKLDGKLSVVNATTVIEF